MRTEQEIRSALIAVESHMTGDEDTEDPIEVMREVLLFALGDRQFEDAIEGFLPL